MGWRYSLSPYHRLVNVKSDYTPPYIGEIQTAHPIEWVMQRLGYLFLIPVTLLSPYNPTASYRISPFV